MLSGFLISGLLFREYQKTSSIDIVRFLTRRGFKIYPAFWVLIAFTVSVYALSNNPFPWWGLAGDLLFLQNYLGGIWGHTWSLAVEEHFYICLAIAISLMCRRKLRGESATPFAIIIPAFLMVALLCLSLRIVTSAYWPFTHLTHLWPTHLRIDSLFFGVAISYFWHCGNLKKNSRISACRLPMLIVGALLLAPAFRFPVQTPWIPVIGVTMFYVGSGMILLASLYYHVPQNIVTKSFAAVGVFSYSIYLWHVPMATWGVRAVRHFAGDNFTWTHYAFTYIFGSIFLGIVTAKMIELPLLRIRDRIFPSSSGRFNAGGHGQ